MQSQYTESLRSSAEGYAQQSWGQQYGNQQLSPGEAVLDFLREYSRERPEVVAMWAFGIGFVLGWKMKP